jgi:DNA replication initiation complex subunit (GINS family)
MKIDVNVLSEILRKEKMSPDLQAVEKDFYSLLKEYCDEASRKHSGHSKELENIKKIANDIYETREKKIVLNALYYARSGEDIETENLSIEEEEMLRRIIKILSVQRSDVLEKIISGKAQGKAVMQEVSYEAVPTVTIRILKELPPIVGVDGKTYGSFKVEDIVTLPEPNAEVFISQGFAEVLKIGDLKEKKGSDKHEDA